MVRPPYQAVLRLWVNAEAHWAFIDGEAASKGVDYLTLPIDRFFNVIFWWVSKRVKDAERFARDLERPLGGTHATAPSQEELEREGEDFMAFAAAFGVQPPKLRPEEQAEAV